MEPQLRPPQAPMLRYAHLEMFAERFPQQRKEADYAIAGGAAVMLLLEAASVEGYDVADSTADNRRMHKDLEIYAFKHVFSYLNRNAHDLAFLSDANNFCRVEIGRAHV